MGVPAPIRAWWMTDRRLVAGVGACIPLCVPAFDSELGVGSASASKQCNRVHADLPPVLLGGGVSDQSPTAAPPLARGGGDGRLVVGLGLGKERPRGEAKAI